MGAAVIDLSHHTMESKSNLARFASPLRDMTPVFPFGSFALLNS